MKNSIIIVLFLVLGIIIGRTDLSNFIEKIDFSYYVLALLMFLVGVATGSNPKTIEILKQANLKIILIPLSTIVGTLLGVAIISFFIPLKLSDSLAIGAGFGYYSLSSVIISELKSEALGVVALLSNVFREIFTLLFTPLLVKYFGKITPIAVGGATSMDTTLPIITKYSGTEYAIFAIFSGTVLTILVPILVSFFIQF